MFDISFPELVLIGVVALLVIGPDKLPETVRTVALWVGRIRRSLASIRADIEREIGADEIRQQLHNESIMQELKKTKEQIGGIIKDAENQISDIKDSATFKASGKLEKDASVTAETPSTSDLAHDTQDNAHNNTQDTPQEDDGRKQSEPGR